MCCRTDRHAAEKWGAGGRQRCKTRQCAPAENQEKKNTAVRGGSKRTAGREGLVQPLCSAANYTPCANMQTRHTTAIRGLKNEEATFYALSTSVFPEYYMMTPCLTFFPYENGRLAKGFYAAPLRNSTKAHSRTPRLTKTATNKGDLLNYISIVARTCLTKTATSLGTS